MAPTETGDESPEDSMAGIDDFPEPPTASLWPIQDLEEAKVFSHFRNSLSVWVSSSASSRNIFQNMWENVADVV